MNLGFKIRHFRKLRNLTLKELGTMVGVSEQAIGQYERNQREPNLVMLNKIALNLDIPVSFLVNDNDFENYMNGNIASFNKKGFEYSNKQKVNVLPAISIDDMKNKVNSMFPAFEAEINFLTNPNIEKCFNYSFKDLENRDYAELLINNIENAIKDTLLEIKENEDKGNIYVSCWGRWIDKNDTIYDNIKKIKDSFSKKDK
ncbi:helix-turn-helix domain-containing protein [Clostridium perfringens]|uniref:Helix-turn-helix transcriptional regulator n=1 Tax=Clostridium perfringens TaxID=1502 RepID=A0AAP4A913_CLOPF|nr:helix-turn-helix transcriptional regulator [Clostridium perfringens]MDH2337508.1 helix-turn-helix transcriptional regulator [Clostridium perfringens]